MQPRPRGDRLRERDGLARRHAALAVLATDVDLDADVEWRQMHVALCRQALGDLQAVDAMHPVEGIRHRTGLVALQRADEMPLEAERTQRLDLVHALLHVVLAESALPGDGSLAHGLRGPGLAHREQLHVGGVAPGTSRRVVDAGAHRVEARSDRRHVPWPISWDFGAAKV